MLLHMSTTEARNSVYLCACVEKEFLTLLWL